MLLSVCLVSDVIAGIRYGCVLLCCQCVLLVCIVISMFYIQCVLLPACFISECELTLVLVLTLPLEFEIHVRPS